MKKKLIMALVICSFAFSACSNKDSKAGEMEKADSIVTESSKESDSYGETQEACESESKEEKKLEIQKSLKTRGNTNPIISQDFGADPYAMVYGDTIYFYMTADAFEYDASGEIKDNSYSQISSIRVVSTKDMKNFEDHGLIPVAGKDGIAKWAKNSWAPAACWKNIDGEDRFFLYFADNGGGIGVVSSSSPTGPFEDPLGHGLITRDMEGCSDVLWLFDPAVLVDDDGTGYIYFGGGVPEGKISNPGTGRCARLTDDMIGLDMVPVAIDVPYLFEDSGIHKFNNKYYYTYCTNWSVDNEGTSKYGFVNAEIAMLESDSPLGPFTYKETILANPGSFCGLYGNNHHCVFSFKDQWYITYHSRILEKKMGIEKGYRSTNIDAFTPNEDGSIGKITQTAEGPDQLVKVNPFENNKAVCVSSMTGCNIVPSSEDITYGNMNLGEITEGGFVEIDGVDFTKSPSKIKVLASSLNAEGKVHVRLDFVTGEDIAVVEIKSSEADTEFTADIKGEITGEHFLYLVFEGEGYTLSSWCFE